VQFTEDDLDGLQATLKLCVRPSIEYLLDGFGCRNTDLTAFCRITCVDPVEIQKIRDICVKQLDLVDYDSTTQFTDRVKLDCLLRPSRWIRCYKQDIGWLNSTRLPNTPERSGYAAFVERETNPDMESRCQLEGVVHCTQVGKNHLVELHMTMQNSLGFPIQRTVIFDGEMKNSFATHMTGGKPAFAFPDSRFAPTVQVSVVYGDIRQTSKAPPRALIFCVDKVATPLVVKNVEGDTATAILFRTEREMLVGISTWLKSYDPDLLSGYNIDKFDDPFLMDRGVVLGVSDIQTNFTRMKASRASYKRSMFQSRAFGSMETCAVTHVGIQRADLLPYLQKAYKLDYYSLNDSANFFLGEKKDDVNPEEIPELCKTPRGRQRLAIYCVRDSLLVWRLWKCPKLLFYERMVATSRFSGCTLQHCVSRGVGYLVEMTCKLVNQHFSSDHDPIFGPKALHERKLRAKYVLKRNVPIGDKRTNGKNSAEEAIIALLGGSVLEPERKMHSSVMVLDFAALYPGIIIEYNLCITTVVNAEATIVENGWKQTTETNRAEVDVRRGPDWELVVDSTLSEADKTPLNDAAPWNSIENQELIAKYGLRFVEKLDKKLPAFVTRKVRQGLFCMAEEYLLGERDKSKANRDTHPKGSPAYQAYDADQNAVKVIANSIYGASAFSASSFYDIRVSGTVTRVGRFLIEQKIIISNQIAQRAAGFPYDTRIVYGDTDSIFVLLLLQIILNGYDIDSQWDSPEEKLNICNAGKVLQDKINSILSVVCTSLRIQTKFEKYLRRIIIQEKKRYAYLSLEYDPVKNKLEKPAIKFSGWETVRRDFFKAIGESLKAGISKILYEGEKGIASCLADFGKTLYLIRSGQIEYSKIIQTRRLSKSIEDYTNAAPASVNTNVVATTRNPKNDSTNLSSKSSFAKGKVAVVTPGTSVAEITALLKNSTCASLAQFQVNYDTVFRLVIERVNKEADAYTHAKLSMTTSLPKLLSTLSTPTKVKVKPSKDDELCDMLWKTWSSVPTWNKNTANKPSNDGDGHSNNTTSTQNCNNNNNNNNNNNDEDDVVDESDEENDKENDEFDDRYSKQCLSHLPRTTNKGARCLTAPAHVKLSKKMRDRDEASAPRPGDRIAFVICTGKDKKVTVGDCSEEAMYAYENKLALNWDFYAEKFLHCLIGKIKIIVDSVNYQREQTNVDRKKVEDKLIESAVLSKRTRVGKYMYELSSVDEASNIKELEEEEDKKASPRGFDIFSIRSSATNISACTARRLIEIAAEECAAKDGFARKIHSQTNPVVHKEFEPFDVKVAADVKAKSHLAHVFTQMFVPVCLCRICTKPLVDTSTLVCAQCYHDITSNGVFQLMLDSVETKLEANIVKIASIIPTCITCVGKQTVPVEGLPLCKQKDCETLWKRLALTREYSVLATEKDKLKKSYGVDSI
jgi:DNA polymerase elongation subunit (family B)